MRLPFQNKVVELSPAAEADLARRLQESALHDGLTDAERNEIGKRVALAAEAAGHRPYMDKLAELAEPTKAEADALAAAEATWQKAYDQQHICRGVAAQLARHAQDLVGFDQFYGEPDPDHARKVARARQDARDAEVAFERASQEEQHAQKAVHRARGAILQNASARQGAFMRSGQF